MRSPVSPGRLPGRSPYSPLSAIFLSFSASVFSPFSFVRIRFIALASSRPLAMAAAYIIAVFLKMISAISIADILSINTKAPSS